MRCEYCGNEFAAQRSTARFCSSNCRVYAFRQGTSGINVTRNVTDSVTAEEVPQEYPLVLAACQTADRHEREFYERLRDQLGEVGVERLLARFVKAGVTVTPSVTHDEPAARALYEARSRIDELEEELRRRPQGAAIDLELAHERIDELESKSRSLRRKRRTQESTPSN